MASLRIKESEMDYLPLEESEKLLHQKVAETPPQK